MILDIVFAGILLMVLYKGFSRGLIFSVFWLLSIVVGITAAVSLSHITASYIESWFHIHPTYLPLVSFIATMFLLAFVFRMAGRLIEGLFQALQLNFFNKLAGALVWGVSWCLIFSCICWYGNNMGMFTDTLKSESRVYAPLLDFAPGTIEWVGKIAPIGKDVFKDMQEWFNQSGEQIPPPQFQEV